MLQRFLIAGMVLVASISLVQDASAKPAFLDTLTKTYAAHSDVLQTRACANCHTTTGDFSRTAYGKELESLIKKSGGQDLTPAILKQAESASPAAGSETFGALINSDKDPNTVVPATAASSSGSAGSTVSPSTPTPTPSAPSSSPAPSKPVFPSNFEHPAIVHFPIALFIGGLFLDALGFFRKDKNLLMAGWYDLVLAAVSSLGAVATGLGAMILMDLPLTGIIRLHMLGALLSTVLMWTLVGLRAYKHEKLSTPGRIAYYAVAAANLVLISVVGHLGGQFVYGS